MMPHTTTETCWCEPSVCVVCPECNGDTDTCWRCDGDGVIPYVPLRDGEFAQTIVVHQGRP